ncbi:hypothetical protein F5Y16DRAFT_105292 [Xylariaceae sp. FL0255]|nr:hypothetical protein F5Y16DRAFT_105292 [Xylariaceae sp. FL0255]
MDNRKGKQCSEATLPSLHYCRSHPHYPKSLMKSASSRESGSPRTRTSKSSSLQPSLHNRDSLTQAPKSKPPDKQKAKSQDRGTQVSALSSPSSEYHNLREEVKRMPHFRPAHPSITDNSHGGGSSNSKSREYISLTASQRSAMFKRLQQVTGLLPEKLGDWKNRDMPRDELMRLAWAAAQPNHYPTTRPRGNY